jgi:Bacterial Ig-like domain (group 2)
MLRMNFRLIFKIGEHMKHWFYLITSSLLSLGLTACPNNASISDPNKIVSIQITGISMLEVGQGATLSAQALNSSNASVPTTFTWSSSNPSVLAVEAATGKISAKKTGSASIQAKASDANQTKQSSSLNVTMILRIDTQAYGDEPVTIFISNPDGSLLQSKTVTSGAGAQKLEFPGIASDAFVTAAYKFTSGETVWNGTAYVVQSATHYRISSYPASVIRQDASFVFGETPLLGSLSAQIAKPALSDVTVLGGTTAHLCCSYSFGANTNVTLSDNLYQSELQSDGKYSPVLFAYDANSHVKAYVPFLDQTYDPGSPNKTLSVAQTDWKTDVSTANFEITNVPAATNAYAFCTSVQGYRKGILINSTWNPCDARNTNGATITVGPREYLPGIYDQLEYQTGWADGGTTKPGDPYSGTALTKRGSSLASTISLNAVNDFLPPIVNFALTNTTSGRPTFTWTALANAASLKNLNAQIYDLDNLGTYDYFWHVYELPLTTSTFAFPELPAALSDFAPKEGNAGRKYRAGIWYTQQSSDGLTLQESDGFLNFDPVAVRSRPANTANAQHGHLPEQFGAIRLEQ